MKSLSMFGFASSILSVRFHRRGERIPPCGQPSEIFLVMERPWSCMVIVLSDSIVFIQSAIPLGIFASSSALWIELYLILSNAPSTSRKMPSPI